MVKGNDMKRFLSCLAFLALMAVGGVSLAQPKNDLSTIALDAVGGKVAVGMTVELYVLGDAAPRKLAQAVTGDDGRATLLPSGPIPAGTYELRFRTADYFRKEGVAVGDPAMLDTVLVRFSITDPTGHYHVPLIFTPTGYTTYRGS
jgi:hydroxyisourate hydrolase